jgi:hypothetical protein
VTPVERYDALVAAAGLVSSLDPPASVGDGR